MTNAFSNRRRMLLGGLLAGSGAFSISRVMAAGGDMGGDKQMHGDLREHHDHAAMPAGVKRSEADYKIPALTLVRQDGTKVAFPRELDDGRPVILDFIYTACTSICPISSQVFFEVQQKLGGERNRVNMVSISIDPEFDTPARLTEYAKKFHAAAQWQHYTGTVAASIAIQKAFGAYRGDKMNHIPVTFLRAAPGKPWVRLDGFASPDLVVKEIRNLVKGA